ncbi:hypothetical protein AAFF_G00300250 [Aldrovandia affinis]|uniref:Uncharacterized protein n=1 Tax=Aldrovandia affinis TaxID=143900 RepID=A0AAD7WR81_9TELE|nr:hypothetical protein AAFF_G00300250 [Aldrovandia affinis]
MKSVVGMPLCSVTTHQPCWPRLQGLVFSDDRPAAWVSLSSHGPVTQRPRCLITKRMRPEGQVFPMGVTADARKTKGVYKTIQVPQRGGDAYVTTAAQQGEFGCAAYNTGWIDVPQG